MAKMHIRHKRHINPAKYSEPHKVEKRRYYESVIRDATRYNPLPTVQSTPNPAFGIYTTLDKELQLRQHKRQGDAIYPWPSTPKRGLYSKRDYEKDLQQISVYEAAITHAIAVGGATGIDSRVAYGACDRMRSLCKAALMRTRTILQAKDAEAKASPNTPSAYFNGIRLTAAQQEHIRRMGTDRAYLERQLSDVK